MFTDITYQDWLDTPDGEKPDKLVEIIRRYKASADFKVALQANAYFRAENPETAKKMLLKPTVVSIKDDKGKVKKRTRMAQITGNRVYSGFFNRFVIQQNQYLLGNGVTLKDDKQKEKLGMGFDKKLEAIGERALLHGVAWGFWNVDHLEMIEAATDALTGFVAVVDERTSTPMLGVQFWQLSARRPMYIRLFEVEGVSEYTCKEGEIRMTTPRQAYKINTVTDDIGEMVVSEENWGVLPVVPFYANTEKRSELTWAIKSKIDLYDRILSDFGDNLDRACDVYWVLNNFGGTTDEIAETIAKIEEIKAVANISDGTGTQASAEPKTIEVPYQARREALDLLEKALYQDYMALSMKELTGGSLTNVAIETAMLNLNLKVDRYEWQAFSFVQQLLALAGVESEEIRFKRQTLVNRSEIVQDISTMRPDIDQETALKLNPYIEQEEIAQIMANKDGEAYTGAPSMKELDKMLTRANQAAQ